MQEVSDTLNYQPICLQYHAAEKNRAMSQVLMATLFEQENKNLLRMKNPDELLSETPLFFQSIEFT